MSRFGWISLLLLLVVTVVTTVWLASSDSVPTTTSRSAIFLRRTTSNDERQQQSTLLGGRHDDAYMETNTIDAGTSRQREVQVAVGGFVDSDVCWDAMVASDANADGYISPDEYVVFATTLEPNVLPESIDTFEELPLVYKAAFMGTACKCQDPEFGGDVDDETCCTAENAKIRIPVSPDENPSQTDSNYLYWACSLTSGAAETVQNSQAPTVAPPTTGETTAAPSTRTPSVVPPPTTTLEPTLASSTLAPQTTTLAPTPSLVPTNVTVPYEIGLVEGIQKSQDVNFVTEYLANLITAMNIVSVNVAADTTPSSERRVVQETTAAAVVVDTPTDFASVDNMTCPDVQVVNSDMLCQNITALIKIEIVTTETTNVSQTAMQFQTDVSQAIIDGDLQRELDTLYGGSGQNPVVVLTGLAGDNPSPSGGQDPDDDTTDENREVESKTLSSGAIAGIVLGAFIGTLIIPAAVYIWNRETREPKPDYEEYGVEDDDKKAMKKAANDDDLDDDLQSGAGTDAAIGSLGSAAVIVGATTLGAAQADYGTHSRKAAAAIVNDGSDEEEEDDDHATSSNAGSSGWSSSAGISSLNTGSMDERDDIALAAGATLAGLGVASAMARNLKSHGKSDDEGESGSEVPSVTRDQLDDLIEAGDWAAVGATAALLAAASDSQSAASMSRGSRSRSHDSNSIDARRAAELDHLVDAGDWEGVVAAAARFEAQSAEKEGSGSKGSGSRGSRTNSSEASSANGTGSATGSNTAGSPSLSTSISEGNAQKRAEIRSEVEALVRRVVPEEIDNVDEMMKQFKGREEELVETLRTMQERAAAQKARAAVNKSAKMDAKRNVQRGVVPGVTVPPSAASSSASIEKVAKARTALEDAIEAGDWDAVGQAAALIGENSGSSVGTDEINRLAETNLSVSTSGTTESRKRNHLSGVNAERATELDAMIDRGDWSGVAALANRFSVSDKKAKSGTMSKEEEDALKEAELWMKIAEQKKAEGATDTGASEAAEWAIQRSLSQLREAEKKSRKGGGGGGSAEEDEV